MTKADPAKEYALLCEAVHETQNTLARAVLETQRTNLARCIREDEGQLSAAEQARRIRHYWMGH